MPTHMRKILSVCSIVFANIYHVIKLTIPEIRHRSKKAKKAKCRSSTTQHDYKLIFDMTPIKIQGRKKNETRTLRALEFIDIRHSFVPLVTRCWYFFVVIRKKLDNNLEKVSLLLFWAIARRLNWLSCHSQTRRRINFQLCVINHNLFLFRLLTYLLSLKLLQLTGMKV